MLSGATGTVIVHLILAIAWHLSTQAYARGLYVLGEEPNQGVERRPFNRIGDEQAVLNSPESIAASGYRYYTNETSRYFVHSMPEIDLPLGELYSGNLPIATNSSETLFFFFKPKTGEPVDELTIWLNGGPGWSSMEGFFQENGPVIWQMGTYGPVKNMYAWNNLTNMLWVDQPIGTGFSTGTPHVIDENDVSSDFLGFMRNFQDLFGIKDYKIYLTGESYAAMYIPYIGQAMLDADDTRYFNLSGAMIYEAAYGAPPLLNVALVPFIQASSELLNYNSSFMAQLEALHESCGHAEYIERYTRFPATEIQPTIETNETCGKLIFDALLALLDVNPCASIYDIRLGCPIQYDPLGHPTMFAYSPPGVKPYFDREDVKRAIHAPVNHTWRLNSKGVFVGPYGLDKSEDPRFAALPRLIEGTNRVLISFGEFDMIATKVQGLLAFQNMTWNGKLGFEEEPTEPIDIPFVDLQWDSLLSAGGVLGFPYASTGHGQGIMGVQHYERGLMWAETYQSGHVQPANQPRAAYRHLQWLLGHIDRL